MRHTASATFQVSRKLDNNDATSYEGSPVTCTPGSTCTLTDATNGVFLACNKLAEDLTCDWTFSTTDGTEAPLMGGTIHYMDATYAVSRVSEPSNTATFRITKSFDIGGSPSYVGSPIVCASGSACTLTDVADGVFLSCDQLSEDLTCDWSFSTTAGTEAPLISGSIHYMDATYSVSK